VQHRVVLKLGGNQVLFAFPGPEVGRRADGLIVGLGTAGGKIDLAGIVRAQNVRNGFAGALQAGLCVLREGVQAGRIAVVLREIGEHRVQRRLAHRRGGGIVCINEHSIRASLNPICLLGIYHTSRRPSRGGGAVFYIFPPLAGEQIGQGHGIEIAVGQLIHLPPHGQSQAGAGPLTGGYAVLDADHRGEIVLNGTQHLPHGIILWTAAKAVAALLAPGAFHQSGLLQAGDNHLQILHAQLLPLRYGGEGDAALVGMGRKIGHDPQRVAPFCGDVHVIASLWL